MFTPSRRGSLRPGMHKPILRMFIICSYMSKSKAGQPGTSKPPVDRSAAHRRDRPRIGASRPICPFCAFLRFLRSAAFCAFCGSDCSVLFRFGSSFCVIHEFEQTKSDQYGPVRHGAEQLVASHSTEFEQIWCDRAQIIQYPIVQTGTNYHTRIGFAWCCSFTSFCEK